jgi:putative two-component system response regulator
VSADARGTPGDLVHARLQLEAYARDLRDAIVRERDANRQLLEARRQLDVFLGDVRKLMDQERDRRLQLECAYRETLTRLARASAFRDDETAAHCDRLRHYTAVLCRELRLPDDEAERIAAAAPMHDLGKIGIPDEILNKKGSLDPEEWKIMRAHPGIGASLLRGSNSELIETARQIALTHHECYDGTGYPQGLAGEAIPFSGRIVKLADSYDALRSKRSYKPSFDHDDTCKRILEGDGRTLPRHFDPHVLEAFRATADRFAEIVERTGADDTV